MEINIDTPNPVPPQEVPSTTLITPQPMKKRSPFLLIVSIIIGMICFGALGYGIMNALFSKPTQTPVTAMPSKPSIEPYETAVPMPTNTLDSQFPSLGQTSISYAVVSGTVYLKMTTDLLDPIAEFPNSTDRTKTFFYTPQPDGSLETIETDPPDVSNDAWKPIITRDIQNTTESPSVLVNDEIMGIKRMGETNDILFIVSWYRGASSTNNGAWNPTDFTRTIYLYKNINKQATSIISYMTNEEKNSDSYSFPMFGSLDPSNKYLQVSLFGCWNCGGHQPETLLVNLETLETKNIGKVSSFTWGDNGSYSFTDYIVIPCTEVGPGECSKEPESLPEKTGTM